MMLRWLLAVFAMASLAACKPPPTELSGIRARPALWEVSGKDGASAWLFGTVHSLPDDVEWRTPAIQAALGRSDRLVLEVANLDDQAALARIFSQLARTPGQPPLSQRLPPASRPALARMLERAKRQEADFSDVESWAAALTLAQSVKSGDSENGVDRALRAMARAKPVIELEGAAQQLGLFDGLPERDQRDLLLAVVTGAHSAQADETSLAKSWLSGNMAAIARETQRGMLADPELREALLVKRNIAWARRITALLEQGRRPFIAVGAAHMAGPEGLPALLAARGWTVRRIE